MGRSRAFDPDTCLQSAIELFWSKGYEATSMDDIVTATGVNRASLYATFGGKKDLFLAALDRYGYANPDGIFGAPSDFVSVRNSLEKWFDRKARMAKDPITPGCMVTNTVTELGSRDAEVRASVQEHLAQTENQIDSLLRLGLASGEIAADADIRERARHLLATMQGFQVLAKVNPDPKLLNQIAQSAIRSAIG